MKKKIILIAVVAALLTGTVALAASLTDEQQEFFDQRKEVVDEMVESERITQDQADEYLEGLEERLLDGTCDGTGLGADGEGRGMGFGKGNFGRCADEDGFARGYCGGRGN